MPAVCSRIVILRQGSHVVSQLELSARAALCRRLAKHEPKIRIFWMAEAENWSRLSNERAPISRLVRRPAQAAEMSAFGQAKLLATRPRLDT